MPPAQQRKYPKLGPVKCKTFECRQSRYPLVPPLPLRACVYGPGGSGKSHLLVNLCLDVYRGCFERIYVFSPSVSLDHVWDPLKAYSERELHVDLAKEPCFFDRYDAAALEDAVTRQFRLADRMKREGRRVFSVLVLIDDFADDRAFLRHEKLLHQLFVRGRHSFVSTIVSSQKIVCVAPICRVNCSALFVFRLRSMQDLDTFVDETSALVSKRALLEMYRLATREPHSFLFVNLLAHRVEDMFFINFSHRLVPPP